MSDCQQVLPSDGVSAWTRDLSHSQREAQEHKHTQTLYLQLTQPINYLHSLQVLEEGGLTLEDLHAKYEDYSKKLPLHCFNIKRKCAILTSAMSV